MEFHSGQMWSEPLPRPRAVRKSTVPLPWSACVPHGPREPLLIGAQLNVQSSLTRKLRTSLSADSPREDTSSPHCKELLMRTLGPGDADRPLETRSLCCWEMKAPTKGKTDVCRLCRVGFSASTLRTRGWALLWGRGACPATCRVPCGIRARSSPGPSGAHPPRCDNQNGPQTSPTSPAGQDRPWLTNILNETQCPLHSTQ